MRNGLPPLRVMCVDDNRDVADSEAMLLECYGFEVETCYDGASALATALRFGPDVCLIDFDMPEMDGIELAQRAGDLAPDMRVMFITGFAAVTLKAGKQVPQARVLSKPFHLRDLVLEVDRLFESESIPSRN